MFSGLENLLKSQGYKIAFLTKDKEQMLTAFEKGIVTPIFAFYQDKSRINIGHFWKCSGGCAEIGFSEAVNRENLSDVFIRIQELRKEIQKQTKIPYLDERMRWQGYFTKPDEIIKSMRKNLDIHTVLLYHKSKGGVKEDGNEQQL